LLPNIIATATAVPELRVDQSIARDMAHDGFDIAGMLASVYENSGVAARHSSVPIEWFLKPTNWPDRMAQYHVSAMVLLEKVTADILASAGLDHADIDMVITVSTTGIVIPSLDAQLIEKLPFRQDVDRMPVLGYGCAGGTMGIRRAADMAIAKPGQNILLLVVELSSINFRMEDKTAANFVSTAIFGDGCAGVILRHDPDAGHDSFDSHPKNGRAANGMTAMPDGSHVSIGPHMVHNWPDSLDLMGFSVEEDGFGVVLSPAIPRLAAKNMGAPVNDFLSRHDLTLDDIDGYIVHPGGRRVLEGIETSLDITKDDLSVAYDVLENYGNMSAATVLFVLDRTIKSGAKGKFLMTAFGPGFSLALQLIDIG